MSERNKLRRKVLPINVAGSAMMTNKKPRSYNRFHSRLAFFAQLQRFYYLPLLVGLHVIADTTYITKVGQLRKDVLEGHAPFCCNVSAKDVCTINFTVTINFNMAN